MLRKKMQFHLLEFGIIFAPFGRRRIFHRMVTQQFKGIPDVAKAKRNFETQSLSKATMLENERVHHHLYNLQDKQVVVLQEYHAGGEWRCWWQTVMLVAETDAGGAR